MTEPVKQAVSLKVMADDKTVPVKAATLRALLAAHGQCVIPEDGEL